MARRPPPELTGLLPDAVADWAAPLADSPLVSDGEADTEQARAPLVFDGQRLYLRRHWAQENAVAERIRARLADTAAPPPGWPSGCAPCSRTRPGTTNRTGSRWPAPWPPAPGSP